MLSERLRPHFLAPQHQGELLRAPNVLHVRVGKLAAGIVIQLHCQIIDEVIVAAKFKAYGEPVVIALSDIVVASLLKKPVHALRDIHCQQLINEWQLAPLQRASALLLEDAAKALWQQYEEVMIDV